MASFYKRGDYPWEAKIREAGFPQLAKTFESKADAVAWAAEVETERKTLGALIGQYVQDVSPLHRGAEIRRRDAQVDVGLQRKPMDVNASVWFRW